MENRRDESEYLDASSTPKFSKKEMVIMIAKLYLISPFASMYQYGVVLLIPSFVREYNLYNELNIEACGSIQGFQFLILTIIFGGCNLLGRLTSYVLKKFLS